VRGVCWRLTLILTFSQREKEFGKHALPYVGAESFREYATALLMSLCLWTPRLLASTRILFLCIARSYDRRFRPFRRWPHKRFEPVFYVDAGRSGDTQSNVFKIREHVVIRNSKYGPTLCLDEFLPTKVVFAARSVTLAVNFYNQTDRLAREINDVRTDRMLSTKLESSQTTTTQNTPQFLFGNRHILS